MGYYFDLRKHYENKELELVKFENLLDQIKERRKMYLFICCKCGNIQKYDRNIGTIGLKCEKCNNEMGWESSFPPLTALNFRNSAQLLLKQIKKQEQDNLEVMYSIIRKEYKLNVDKTFLDKWLNKYERWLEKYPDNNDIIWIERDNQFEDIICNELGSEVGMCIFSTIRVSRNYYRKPYIIMISSMIEQLFNDYFNNLIAKKLSKHRAKNFLKEYENLGIQKSIDIIESFLDESLISKMDKYSKGFFDRWASLRKLRNDIIHSNSIYISKNRISKVSKMIDESFLVFSHLRSEIYEK